MDQDNHRQLTHHAVRVSFVWTDREFDESMVTWYKKINVKFSLT